MIRRKNLNRSGSWVVAVLLGLLAAPPLGLASESQEPELETRVFIVKYKTVEDVVFLVRHAMGEHGSLTIQARIRVVTITDEPASLEQIGRLIVALDLPPRHVHLAVQLLMGSQEPDPEDRAPNTRVPRMPGIDRDLRHTLALTSWTDYRLLGSASFTAAEGE